MVSGHYFLRQRAFTDREMESWHYKRAHGDARMAFTQTEYITEGKLIYRVFVIYKFLLPFGISPVSIVHSSNCITLYNGTIVKRALFLLLRMSLQLLLLLHHAFLLVCKRGKLHASAHVVQAAASRRPPLTTNQFCRRRSSLGCQIPAGPNNNLM